MVGRETDKPYARKRIPHLRLGHYLADLQVGKADPVPAQLECSEVSMRCDLSVEWHSNLSSDRVHLPNLQIFIGNPALEGSGQTTADNMLYF
jgi:hypothetical protein